MAGRGKTRNCTALPNAESPQSGEDQVGGWSRQEREQMDQRFELAALPPRLGAHRARHRASQATSAAVIFNGSSTIRWHCHVRPVTGRMPLEQLTYVQIAQRLNISPEAARAIVKRNRLPRSHRNDGRTLVEIDLDILQHNPLPARSPRGQLVSDLVATLNARIGQIETELAAEQQRSAGHRADYERERERAERANHLVTSQDRIIGELKNLRSLLQLAHQNARPVTSRRWRHMSWRDRWRWLRTTGRLAGAGLLLALSTVPAGAQQQQPQPQPPGCFHG